MTRTHILTAAACSLVGFLLGATVMAALASSASRVFAEDMRVRFVFEERQRGIEAANRRDWLGVLRHYQNAREGDTGALPVFSATPWSLSFPMAAVLLADIISESDKKPNAKRWIEGSEVAVSAMAYEQLGDAKRAAEEYAHAKSLIPGLATDESVRQLARAELSLSER